MQFTFLFRSDAAATLESKGVKKALGRYVKVVKNGLPAKFMIAKKVSVKFVPKAKEQKLWEVHSRAMKKFRQIENEIDSGKLKLENLKSPKQSLLDLKIAIADKIMQHCHFCERRCGANRKAGEKGFCKAGLEWRIFGAHQHFGEESCLVPSGTIFQAACSMRCVYCQNAPESITPELGRAWSTEKVGKWMERIREGGGRNISWVGGSPTPWTWHILQAMRLCNVNISQIWNSNSYYSPETAELLDGIIDVYLLDFRYFSEKCAVRLSSAPNYPAAAKRNHTVAAKAGELLIRLLVMPGHLECDAKPIVKWLRDNLGEWVRLNILAQYHPHFKAFAYKEISRPLSPNKHREIVEYARHIGLKNLERD